MAQPRNWIRHTASPEPTNPHLQHITVTACNDSLELFHRQVQENESGYSNVERMIIRDLPSCNRLVLQVETIFFDLKILTMQDDHNERLWRNEASEQYSTICSTQIKPLYEWLQLCSAEQQEQQWIQHQREQDGEQDVYTDANGDANVQRYEEQEQEFPIR